MRSFFRRYLFILAAATFCLPGRSLAAVGNDQFLEELHADCQRISSFLNGELSRTLAFYSTLGWPSNPEVLDSLYAPRFEIGGGGGIDLVKINISSVSTNALVAGSTVDIPSTLPLPYPVWHTKLGLLRGLDFGVRFTGYPRFERDQISTANRGLGFEMRYQAISSPRLPLVSVNITWDMMRGDAYFSTTVDQNTFYTDSLSDTYNAVVNGTSTYLNAWDVRSFGVKVMVGKSLGIFHPYGAIGIQRHAGKVTSTLRVNVTETLTGGPNGGSSVVDREYTSTAEPPPLQNKYMLGFEIGGGFRWSNNFETNGRDKAFASGFRLQI